MHFSRMGSGLKYIEEIIRQGRDKNKPWNVQNQQHNLNKTKNPHNAKTRQGNKSQP